MKKRVLFLRLIPLLLLPVLLLGCERFSYGDFYGGETVGESLLEEAARQLAETTADRYAPVLSPEGNPVYFWTEGGEVYHAAQRCPNLSAAKQISSGSVETALSEGKQRPCRICAEPSQTGSETNN